MKQEIAQQFEALWFLNNNFVTHVELCCQFHATLAMSLHFTCIPFLNPFALLIQRCLDIARQFLCSDIQSKHIVMLPS